MSISILIDVCSFFLSAQDPLDSLAPFISPAEGFPSITAFFNPEDTISLPSFPPRQHVGYHGNDQRRQPHQPYSYQDSLSLDPFGSIDPFHDSFDEELKQTIPVVPSGATPSAPLEPPPPYIEQSPYFQSPLVNSLYAPFNTSTPADKLLEEEEEDPVNGLRQRDKN